MAQNIILKRSAVPGRVPDTASINLGEVAINTYDGKVYFKKSGSIESVETIVTTDSITSGSIFVSEDITTQRDLYVVRDVITDGDIDASGSLSGSGLSINDTLNIQHNNLQLTGSAAITGSLTVLGEINARQFNINIISSSIIFESGSSKFGNTADDIHSFTGSVDITGSLYVNGVEVGAEGGGSYTGSFTGSFFGDGSGLRGVVSDDIPRDGWDYNSNDSASISEFNVTSSKYLIDFQWEQEVGTPVGLKAFLANTTGSSQIVPTSEGIKFIVGNQLVATVGSEGINATLPSGVVSGSSQLTSSYDSRYVLSGSITQTTWDNIASKPAGIVSGSTQITLNSVDGYTTFSSSIATDLNTLSSSVKAVTDTFATSASIASATETSISTLSASIAIRDNGQDTTTTNISTSVANRLGVIETTYATTGSNTFVGTQVITGSLYVTTDLIVQGSSSLQNITASAVSIGTNTVILNTSTPAVRFGGISVADSGSGAGVSGSLFWDSVNNNWIYQHPSGGAESGMSAILISGPKHSGSLGDEMHITPNKIMVALGDDHIGDSIMEQSASVIKVEVSISSSVIGIGNVTEYSSSINSRINTIETTFSSSISSRVLTIEGKYATTGSNTFVGNQVVSGSITLKNTSNGTTAGFSGTTYGLRIDNGGTFSSGRSTIYGVDTTLVGSYQPLGLQGSAVYIGISNTDVITVASSLVTITGNLIPDGNGTRDLGSASNRWSTIYTSDLSLNNGIGDWTIVEGEDDLFLYNNKKGKVYKFALTEVDPNMATPKIS